VTAHVTLVLGGARSGKSAWAERRAAESGRPVLYLATAEAGDAEMTARIAAHQQARPSSWRTGEEPRDLAGVLRRHAHPGDVVLVDCLTLWLSNLLAQATSDRATAAAALDPLIRAEELLTVVADLGLHMLLVSNEVGMGIVPPYPLGREFRDLLGRLNQTVAARADEVILLVAGLPLDLRRLAIGG
jgi:adenosylcobinamide kinase/adenosylcobinamide-phosphate guanylyltransferase